LEDFSLYDFCFFTIAKKKSPNITNPVIDNMVSMLVDRSKFGRNRSNLGIIALNEKSPKAAETKSSLFTLVRLYASSDKASKKAANIPLAKSNDAGRTGGSTSPSETLLNINRILPNIIPCPSPLSLMQAPRTFLQGCLIACPKCLDDRSLLKQPRF